MIKYCQKYTFWHNFGYTFYNSIILGYKDNLKTGKGNNSKPLKDLFYSDEAINFYVEMGNNKALVVDHTLYDSIDDKSKLVLIDNNTYVDGLNNKSYEIPIIVKECALIKAKETPYSFVKL